ncbi:MAG TPA: squalene--hopene cyclase, partial [Stellaceae bacterium]
MMLETAKRIADEALDLSIERATAALGERQRADGHWVFELEADATIPAEYVLMRHYRAEPVDAGLEAKIAVYLRRIQGTHGGWPLFQDGDFDMSASVKAYFALKMIGDDPDALHMRRAREAILARGGAATSNVFACSLLALYGVLSWRSVPVMPVEIMLLPKWFPFHLDKVSYWARTVLVPLLVLMALKPRAKNPRGVTIDELFTQPPMSVGPRKKAPHQKWSWFLVFRAIDAVLRALEPRFPNGPRRRAIDQAAAFVTERLNGEDGLGAIFPAMVNAYEALALLGYPSDHPARRDTRKAIDDLLVVHHDTAWCQPCVSPVWDTGLTCLAMQEDGAAPAAAIRRALDWLATRQLCDAPGDWRDYRPQLPGGGWAFQFRNDAYPDLDDTAVVARALHQSPEHARFDAAITRAADWLCGMQSRSGGFAAFDANNDHRWL